MIYKLLPIIFIIMAIVTIDNDMKFIFFISLSWVSLILAKLDDINNNLK